jgi:hypothetical protein
MATEPWRPVARRPRLKPSSATRHRILPLPIRIAGRPTRRWSSDDQSSGLDRLGGFRFGLPRSVVTVIAGVLDPPGDAPVATRREADLARSGAT